MHTEEWWVCGWYARGLLGTSMHTQTDWYLHIVEWEENYPGCQELRSINNPTLQHPLPHFPLSLLHHLFPTLPGSDTESFLTAVHSLQVPCNPHILHGHPDSSHHTPFYPISGIKTANLSTSSRCLRLYTLINSKIAEHER